LIQEVKCDFNFRNENLKSFRHLYQKCFIFNNYVHVKVSFNLALSNYFRNYRVRINRIRVILIYFFSYLLKLYNPFAIRIYQIVPGKSDIIDKMIPITGMYIPNPIITVNIPL
jgi:hypothetical protein